MPESRQISRTMNAEEEHDQTSHDFSSVFGLNRAFFGVDRAAIGLSRRFPIDRGRQSLGHLDLGPQLDRTGVGNILVIKNEWATTPFVSS